MKTLFATSELFPFNKTGGLGDVAAWLPQKLKQNGVDIRYIVPAFPSILDKFTKLTLLHTFENIFHSKQINIYKGNIKNNPIKFYLVSAPELFLRAGNPYSDVCGISWNDNHVRFACFSYIISQFATGRIDNWIPDVIHLNDWMTALTPLYLNLLKEQDSNIKVSSILTIHNMAFHGNFHKIIFDNLNLPEYLRNDEKILNNNQISFLKAGINCADKITTVSPTYAQEIQTEPFGFGLSETISKRQNDLTGILNGIDYSIWNPETDKLISANYSKTNYKEGKKQNKLKIQEHVNILQNHNIPLFCILSRLSEQKGIDILLEAIPAIMMHNIQLIIMGTDQNNYLPRLKEIEKNYKSQFAIIPFDEELSHQLIAGCDVLINPAKYEPCGLTQMFAMKYGTIPLVRNTGGLADSIINADFNHTLVSRDATGFSFDNYQVHDLIYTINRCLDIYQNQKKIWNNIIKRAMSQDFSWDRSASEYMDLYNTQLNLIK